MKEQKSYLWQFKDTDTFVPMTEAAVSALGNSSGDWHKVTEKQAEALGEATENQKAKNAELAEKPRVSRGTVPTVQAQAEALPTATSPAPAPVETGTAPATTPVVPLPVAANPTAVENGDGQTPKTERKGKVKVIDANDVK